MRFSGGAADSRNGRKELDGGILCPACGRIHGRCADAMLPMVYLARTTGDARYMDCARALFRWSDNMFVEGKHYINDKENLWNGITVFFCVQLGEILQAWPDLFDSEPEWVKRFFVTADFVRENIDSIGGTVNYPVTGAYAMALAASLCEGDAQQAYRQKAHALAQIACDHILPSGFLAGEGHPMEARSPKGAWAVDIGYNMEESIPALLEYAHLEGDETVWRCAMDALRTHLPLILPDGGMDNSFGSRAFKWTYWGSRTSDGMQAAAELAGGECPEFLWAAERNAELYRACTEDGLLTGGPMYRDAGEAACVHHAFCHAKSLAKALLIMDGRGSEPEASAPREPERFAENLPDLRTWRLREGPWRVTLTDYDYVYAPGSNATGGAVTLLWHEGVGPVLAGSMNRYYSVEPNNMQFLSRRDDVCSTPRVEVREDGVSLRSCQDLTADFRRLDDGSFLSKGILRDEAQRGDAAFSLRYGFADGEFCLTAGCSQDAELILPVIAGRDDGVTYGQREVTVARREGRITVCADAEIDPQPAGARVFNPVGGFLYHWIRIPLSAGTECQVSIRVE